MVVLSVIILCLGLTMLFCPKWILNRIKKEEKSTEIVVLEDEKMITRIRIYGIFYTLAGIIYLTMELNGFISEQTMIYDIFLSLVVLVMGIMLFLLPLYAPAKNTKVKEERIKKAKKLGIFFIVVGILFLVWDYLRFFT